MKKSKRNPQLCTTTESLIKGFFSIYRISGLFKGKARVCSLIYLGNAKFQANTLAGKPKKEIFKMEDVKSGKINIMCIERGE